MVRASIFPLIFLFLLLVIPSYALGTSVSAQVDRNPVAIDESVSYQLIITDPGKGEPDFSFLEKDFEILSRNSSTSMQFINGSRSHTKQYQLSLLPKRIGKITIAPVTVGKQQSNSIELIVTTASPAQTHQPVDFFLEMRATPQSPYVGQQVLVSVKLYIGAPLVSGSLSEPSPDQTEVLKLGEDREFTTTKSGRDYRVNERLYVLFPQQPGILTIPPIVFQGQTGKRSRSFFDPFPQAGPTRRIRSKTVQLDVRPKPAHASQPWLPASSLSATLELSQSIDALTVGEPVTLDLTIRAQGLQATQLPEPKIQIDGAVRTYPDQPDFNDQQGQNGITSTLEKKITVIATEPGTITINGQAIGWWNTTTDKPEYARFQPLTLKVLPGATPDPQENTAPTTPAPQQKLEPRPTAPPSFWTTQVGWFWVSIGLGCCWLVTLLGWWLTRSSRLASPNPRTVQVATTRNELEKQLKKSCAAGDARGARQCIQELYKGDAGQRQNDPGLHNALAELNDHLYSAGTEKNTWDGEELWSAYQAAATKSKSSSRTTQKQGLTPLYDSSS